MAENAPEVRTIDPTEVVLTVDGFAVTGYADGEYIVVERNQDQYTLNVGAYGHALRAKNMDHSGTIRIRVHPTSPFVASGKLRELEKRKDPFPVTCTDNNPHADNGFTAEKAWVKRPTRFIRSKEASGMIYEVTFETHNVVFE